MDMGDFVKAAPEAPEEMYDYIFRSCDSIQDEDYRKLCLRVLEDNREKLMYYPAASKNHHAELGGLLYHTKRMLMNGERVCQVYTNLNKDLVIAGVVLHDIQKIFEIDADTDGMAPAIPLKVRCWVISSWESSTSTSWQMKQIFLMKRRS
ncbi:MAG: TraI domain-containing protein, partial [Firmicutes bacterium]|nr:TraI domain-containing protein [Bacillota bacterium]